MRKKNEKITLKDVKGSIVNESGNQNPNFSTKMQNIKFQTFLSIMNHLYFLDVNYRTSS